MRPVVTSKTPVVTSKTPVVTSKTPVVTSKTPVVTSKAPVRSGWDAVPLAGRLRGLVSRSAHLVHELGKFGIVGAVCYVIDTGVLAVLLANDINSSLAKTIATVIAATLAFIGNRSWTWRHRERSGLHREYALYFIFNAVGLGIALVCLYVSRYGLGSIWSVFRTDVADIISANVVGMAFGTVFRFWTYRRFVFRDH